MSMTAYFTSRRDSKLKISLTSDKDAVAVAACDKYGHADDRITLALTSAERDAMIEALLDMDCTEADEWAAEEAA